MVRVSLALWLPPPPPPPLHAARDVAAATAMTAAPARTNVGRDMKTLLRRIEGDIGVVDTVRRRGGSMRSTSRASRTGNRLPSVVAVTSELIAEGDTRAPSRSIRFPPSPFSRGTTDDAGQVTRPAGTLPTNGTQLRCAPHRCHSGPGRRSAGQGVPAE